MAVPKHVDLFNPTLKALHNLGGSASIEELDEEVSRILNLTDEDLEEMMPDQTRNKFNYRMAWSRTYLKRYGLLENTSRRVWALTQKGREVKDLDKKEVQKYVQAENKKMRLETKSDEDELPEELEWKNELLDILKTMPPDAFERLCKRLLREKNFVQVEVLDIIKICKGSTLKEIKPLLLFHILIRSEIFRVQSDMISNIYGNNKQINYTFLRKKVIERFGEKDITIKSLNNYLNTLSNFDVLKKVEKDKYVLNERLRLNDKNFKYIILQYSHDFLKSPIIELDDFNHNLFMYFYLSNMEKTIKIYDNKKWKYNIRGKKRFITMK